MITVYDAKTGEPVDLHEIDARAAVKTGKYAFEPPGEKPKKAPAKKDDDGKSKKDEGK